MASIVNSTKSYANKFYSDIPELRSSTMNDLEYRDDVDLANMSSVPDITSDQGMLGPELEGAVKEVVKSNLSRIKRATTRTYDWKTKNKSFLGEIILTFSPRPQTKAQPFPCSSQFIKKKTSLPVFEAIKSSCF